MCSWAGVSCSLNQQRVTALNLSGFALQGNLSPHLGNLTFLQSLDVSFNSFTGSIPSELSKLHRLKEMNLSSNQLTGGLPSGIFTNMSALIEINLRYNNLSGSLPNDTCRNTPKLRRMYLSRNQLYGKLPSSIYKCTELEDLRLVSNQFSGNIPSEIGNLTMLRRLSLSENHLEGDIPSSLFNISSLESVYFDNNRLSGSIPVFNSLPKLEMLILEFNNLEGDIPKEIGHLTSLMYLKLNNNNLTGHLPKQVGNLTLLKTLNLHDNKLTGELPGELGNLKDIEYFRTYFDDFYGSIPSSIFNLSTLKLLVLSDNQFSGNLPPNMGLSLSNLEGLYLRTNRLSGEIPISITNASKLTMLELNDNVFTGIIPDFGDLSLLQVLLLAGNNLTAAESPSQELRFLSSLTNCRYLESLDISDNPETNGILPASSIGNLSSSLVSFLASNCSIRGAIPSGIGNLSNLQTLDLSKNHLTGFIPTTMGELDQVRRLFLFDNQLRGYIPHHLCKMTNLMDLYLYGNMLTGPIPACLGQVKSLREVSIAFNKLNSTLPSDFLNLPDLIILNLSSNYLNGQLPNEIGSLSAIGTLDLSNNEFSGKIPRFIDGCRSLEILFLSDNQFNGSIPESLGDVKGLRILDLSNNDLSGSIPESLGKLNLDFFNASYNQLEGEIPDSFANFNAQSFLNNSALCGSARFQVPSCIKKHPRSTSKAVDLTMKYVAPSFVAVFILMVGILVLIRRWRPRNKPPSTVNSSAVTGWKIISERELEQGTGSFSEMNLLGKGSIGSVFKATLADGTDVAVKVFNLQVEGATKIFDTESQILGTVRHRNLVKTLGSCSNTGFKALILAYMPNGSLETWLHSNKVCLDLAGRMKIAIDVAFALEYLHHGHTYPIVHCDIKPSNVLLDADMTAHVGDFGIAKLFDNGEAAVHTKNMATIGYAAPEFGSEGKVSTSGDVYSYGILLLEIFTSKKPTDDMFSAEMSIKEWVGRALQENGLREVVADGLFSRDDQHLQALQSMFHLAMKCLAFSPEKRINMMQVVVSLQKIKASFTVEEIQKKHSR